MAKWQKHVFVGLKMVHLSEHAIRSVLRVRALAVVDGVDGRSVPDETLGRLAELAAVAAALELGDDAARLGKLLLVARKGYVEDLTRAALAVLSGDVT